MSTKPGVTIRSVASMTLLAVPTMSGATSTMWSLMIATSATRAGAPVPSITVPPRIEYVEGTHLPSPVVVAPDKPNSHRIWTSSPQYLGVALRSMSGRFQFRYTG